MRAARANQGRITLKGVEPVTARLTANESSLQASEAMHALGRIGEPAEVAAALAWLLDSAQGWVTGQVLGIDGGLGSVRARGTT
jgi:3-oxoacyl-[acyl-carrier protein] reductase